MKRVFYITFILFQIQIGFSQVATISATKTNVLYVGIENPIEAVIENTSCDSIYLVSTNGVIQGDSCRYSIIPAEVGECQISIYKIKGKDSILIEETVLRVKPFPDYSIAIFGSNEFKFENTKELKYVTKEILCNEPIIWPYSDCGSIDMDIYIVEYELSILRDKQEIFRETITCQEIPGWVKTILCNLEHLDCIFIDKIKIDFGGNMTEGLPLKLLYIED